jgi:hypothetical protein
MFATTNGGGSWADASTGIHAYDAKSVVVAPSSTSTLYLGGGYNGIHRSADGATTWTTLPGTTPQNVGGDFSLGVSATNPNLLYVGANGGGVIRYSDASGTGLGLQVEPGLRITALAVAATDDLSVYATAEPGGGYVTSNGGTSWTNPTFGDEYGLAVAIDPSSADTAYIAEANGAFKTTDHGVTWTKMSALSSCSSIAIDPTNTQILYIGSGGGAVARSPDGGGTWVFQTNGVPSGAAATAMAIDPVTPATVYIGFAGLGLWRTTNSGTMWEQIGLAGWSPLSIAVDPASPKTIYVGVASGGLYKTTTGGQ